MYLHPFNFKIPFPAHLKCTFAFPIYSTILCVHVHPSAILNVRTRKSVREEGPFLRWSKRQHRKYWWGDSIRCMMYAPNCRTVSGKMNHGGFFSFPKDVLVRSGYKLYLVGTLEIFIRFLWALDLFSKVKVLNFALSQILMARLQRCEMCICG